MTHVTLLAHSSILFLSVLKDNRESWQVSAIDGTLSLGVSTRAGRNPYSIFHKNAIGYSIKMPFAQRWFTHGDSGTCELEEPIPSPWPSCYTARNIPVFSLLLLIQLFSRPKIAGHCPTFIFPLSKPLCANRVNQMITIFKSRPSKQPHTSCLLFKTVT